MNKICFLGFFLVTLFAQSQKLTFTDGYIIQPNGKVEFVDLALQKSNERLFSCVVKEKNGVEKIIQPQDIKGYGYVGGKLFNSVPGEDYFAEVVVKGSMSLWKHKASLFIDYSGNTYLIKKDPEEALRSALSECFNSTDLQNMFRNQEESLKNLVIKFNECKDSNYTLYEEKKPTLLFGFGLLGGINQSSLEISGNRNYDYLTGSYSSSTPFYGLALSVSSPALADGLSLQTEVQFFTTTYNGFNSIENINTTEYYDIFMEISSVRVPISLKYSPISVAGFNPFVQAGLSLRFNNAETKLLSEIVDGNVVRINPEEEAMPVNKKMTETWLSIGVGKEFKPFNAEFFFRNYLASSLSNPQGLSADESQYSFGLSISYFKKITK